MMSNPLALWRSLRGCCLILAVAILLAVLGACTVLGWGIGRVTAAPDGSGLDVMLLLDQSQSLYDLGGIGSDPHMLRMEGARLFTSYLGVDGPAPDYRLGVVYFGTQPKLIVPLTSITNAAQRQAVQDALAGPEPLGWTDINAALALAHAELFESERAKTDRQLALVIFTDGRPQTEGLNTPAAESAYQTELHDWVRRFTKHGTAVLTVLLRNSATDADPYIQNVYRPFWVSLAESGIGVRFYDARTSDDLMSIYHDIVVQLHRTQSQGVLIDRVVSQSTDVSVRVPSGWRQATFVMRKSDPALEIAIHRPDGRRLEPTDLDVGYTGAPGESREEIWTVREPDAGTWALRVRGQGTVTAWLDYQPGPPTPTPSATPSQTPTATRTQSPTATAILTATPSPTPTAVPNPEILQPETGHLYGVGETVPVIVRCAGCVMGIEAKLIPPDDNQDITLTLNPTDPARWQGETTPLDVTGWYTIAVRPAGVIERPENVTVVTFQVEATGFPWAWLLIGGLAILSGGAGLLWHTRHNEPRLDGTLRVIRAPGGHAGGERWDLSQRGKSAIILGRDVACDLTLSGDPDIPSRAAQLQAIHVDGQVARPHLIDLAKDGRVLVNGRQAGRQHRLTHGDVIQIGGYSLRYENVLQHDRRSSILRTTGEKRLM